MELLKKPSISGESLGFRKACKLMGKSQFNYLKKLAAVAKIM